MKLLVETKTGLKLTESATKTIVEIEEQIKALEALKGELKSKIIEQMTGHGVKSIENDLVRITYVAPTTRQSLDSKALKAELPDVWNKYSKTSTVSETVKIDCK